jgi:hypothetical protein
VSDSKTGFLFLNIFFFDLIILLIRSKQIIYNIINQFRYINNNIVIVIIIISRRRRRMKKIIGNNIYIKV